MTRRILVQWVDSMSVIRSLITGMLPIGSMMMGAASSAPGWARSSSPAISRPSLARPGAACGGSLLVGQLLGLADLGLAGEPDWPLIFTPQEPQIAARQEQRTESEPSSRSFACSRPSRTESEGSRSTSNSSQ